jgi:hypothetical protein
LGKYHSDANADSNTDCFAIANSDSGRERSSDIFAFWFAGGIAFRDVRFSDLERESDEVAEQGGSAAPPDDVNLAASPPSLASSKGLLDPPSYVCRAREPRSSNAVACCIHRIEGQ